MDAAVNLASDVAHGGVGALSQKNTYLSAASVGLNLVGASLARKALSSSLKLGAARVAGSALKRSRKALQIAQDKAIQRSYVFNQANIGASEGDNVLEGSWNPIAVARQYSWENPF